MSRGRNTESGAAQGARRATEAAPDSARRGKGRWSARRQVTVVLETGPRQPEAISLYSRAGFVEIEGFGEFKDHPLSYFTGKQL